MKKLLTMSLSLVLAVSLVACKKDPPAEGESDNDPPITNAVDPDDGDSGDNGEASNGESSNTDAALSAEDYAFLLTAVAELPDDAALDQIWAFLGGYWVTVDGFYFGFVEIGESKNTVYGVFDSESSGYAELIQVEATGQTDITLTVYLPAMAATATTGARPETNITVAIEISDMSNDGSIRIVIADDNNSSISWMRYTYAGETFEAAYNSAQ